jgi:hypothetical protein
VAAHGGARVSPPPPPQTHLDDEAYEEFLEREMDAQGRPRGIPPVGLWILIAGAVILGIAIVLLR